MGKTEYEIDDLEKWEKQLSQVISRDYPQEFEKMVKQVAYELQARVKKNTNTLAKRTGRLMNSWTVGDMVKKGNEYCIEVYTNVEYAEPVEYGHRNSNGKGFVKGKHMMEISLDEVNKVLPGYLKKWLSEFLAEHPLG